MNNKSLIKKFYVVMFLSVAAVPVVFILVNYSMLLIYTLFSEVLNNEEPFNSSFMYTNFYLIFFIALSILVILGAQYFKKTINRINEIQNTVKQIAYDASVPDKLMTVEESEDEINHLAQSINILIDRLRYKEAMLNQQEKHQDEYLRQLTHDINTPLTALNLELYQFSKELDIQDETLTPLYEKVNYISQLAGKITVVNQYDIDNYYIFNKDVDVGTLIDRSLMKWEYLFDKNDIEVHLSALDDLVWVGDELWLERLLDNIISNIYLHSQTDRIEISLEDELVIRDYGAGYNLKKPYQPGSGSSIIDDISKRFYIDLDIKSNINGTEYRLRQQKSS